MSFQKVVKLMGMVIQSMTSFRTVSFQKVVKHTRVKAFMVLRFRTVSFQKVVKLRMWLM